MKRLIFSEESKADIRAIPQPIAMNILTAIHRLAETGAGNIKTLKDTNGEDGEDLRAAQSPLAGPPPWPAAPVT